MTKAQLKKKLASMSPAKRKATIRKLKLRAKKKRIEAKKAKRKPADDEGRLKEANDLLEEIIGFKEIFTATKEEKKRAARGVTLIELWKGLRAVAILTQEMYKYTKAMYGAGVSRRAEAPEAIGAGVEITQIDPRKLHVFVKSIPGWWDCDEALCWQCPYHRGKGIGAQNRKCADESMRDAYKHNTKVSLAKGIPFDKKKLSAMPRTRLVQILGLLRQSPFSLKNSTKEGLVRWLSPARQKKLFKMTPALKKAVSIPDSLSYDGDKES